MDANRAEAYWAEFRTVVAEKLEVPIERVQRESVFAADLKADSLDIVDLLMDFEVRFQVGIQTIPVLGPHRAPQGRHVEVVFDGDGQNVLLGAGARIGPLGSGRRTPGRLRGRQTRRAILHDGETTPTLGRGH